MHYQVQKKLFLECVLIDIEDKQLRAKCPSLGRAFLLFRSQDSSAVWIPAQPGLCPWAQCREARLSHFSPAETHVAVLQELRWTGLNLAPSVLHAHPFPPLFVTDATVSWPQF